ncbi:MAG: ComEC family competence protein, partial [Cyanobacteria bacterium]|nr:ComEC family competence protein [Cyanobacteriota bacterium]MDW8203115.1 ComEC family competence protein [Cyanobacteriota bacterium SKYGB_h_bin112]
MAGTIAAVLSLAYILGLFATAIPGKVLGIPSGGWAVLLTGVIAAVSLPRYWRTGATRGIYLLAGIVGLVACLYLQWRTPNPSPTDISYTLSASDGDRPAIVVVSGKLTSTPHLTRSGKRQFWLEATQVSETRGRDILSGQPVTGNVYVTVPAKAVKELYPGDIIHVRGVLYHPKPAANPGGFDFQAYLRNHNCFAGLRGWQIERDDRPPVWGWWMVRRRIINAQARWLGEPEAALVSALVIGGRAVDLPYNLKDAFARTGLAHALAASGFQVSLILSVVIALTQQFSSRVQFVSGLVALGIFVGLTGVQPAVMRAAVMGVGALVALVMERQVKPLGSLLLAATVLLLWQPLWIWDLGFQLSLLATLGLMVTVAPLTKWLDWLPTPIASSVAVPIAAYLWTIPLQLL